MEISEKFRQLPVKFFQKIAVLEYFWRYSKNFQYICSCAAGNKYTEVK